MVWAILLSVFVVSLISLVGVFILSFSIERLRNSLFLFVAFAVGALLGDVFLHLLPEAIEAAADPEPVFVLVLAGIAFFFVLEKFFHWTHEHEVSHEGHIHPVGYLNLLSDGVHNAIDGAVIAAAYLVSFPVGIATTIAVMLHEIPQEISDFSILIHAGFSKRKALVVNFLSACIAFLGAGVVIMLGNVESLDGWLSTIALPLTAGAFLYIAGSDLVPRLQERNRTREALLQFCAIGAGVFLLYALTWLE